ncbi:unnamed protein product [Paramecium sonneborni]|uniref:Uncharacterized protein n=1 Tax=Paramecium sonneborni TaxID=65129 RepID=A0A8S1L8S4_9CILI|nr:unnamed protein product [Paramecium sonneborni]
MLNRLQEDKLKRQKFSQSIAYFNAEQEKQQQLKNEQKLKQMIKQKLKSFPKPKNEFTVEISQVDTKEQKEMQLQDRIIFIFREKTSLKITGKLQEFLYLRFLSFRRKIRIFSLI